VLVAVASTIVVFGLLGYAIATSPGWPRVQQTFFDAERFIETFPDILPALWKNIQLFLVGEVLILVLALVLAVMRSLPGPAFFPFRLMSVAYIDFFRGIPSILVIYLLGFGIPGLRIPGLTNDPVIGGRVALGFGWSA